MDDLLSNNLSLEDALTLVGNGGKYQLKVFFAMAMQFIAQVFLLLSPTYLFISPPLICSITTDSCENNKETCDTANNIISFDPTYSHTTFIGEFNLICDKSYLIPIASSSMFFGSIIGCLFFSYIGDARGRRDTLRFAWGITTIGIVSISFTFNMYWYIVFNIVAGFGVNGAFNVCFVILNETAGSQFRQKASIGLMVVFGASEILCALMYYAIDNWRIVWIIFAAIPSIIGMLLCLSINETPKYYMTINQFDKVSDLFFKLTSIIFFITLKSQAFDALDLIASINDKNKIDRSRNLQLNINSVFNKSYGSFQNTNTELKYYDTQIQRSNSFSSINELQVKFGYLDLFRYKSLRMDTFGFMGMMFTIQIIYYSGQYSLNKISTGNSVYFIGAIVGFVELLAYIFANFTVEKMPRRKSIIICQIISIFFMCCYLFFGLNYSSIEIPSDCNFCQKEILILTLVCLVRISISFCFGIQPLYTAEAYPTVIRTIGTGFVFSFGLIGSFLSPYTFPIADKININPYIIIIALCIVGPFMTQFARETYGVPLKDDIDEVADNKHK